MIAHAFEIAFAVFMLAAVVAIVLLARSVKRELDAEERRLRDARKRAVMQAWDRWVAEHPFVDGGAP